MAPRYEEDDDFDDDDDDSSYDEPESNPHSGLGIASFILSLISAVLMFICVVIAGVMASQPGGMNEQSAEAMLVGLAIIVFAFLSLVALGLGIGGLCQPDRKKIFAILGIIIAVASIAGVIFLMILGMMMK
jgi:hypothetical protein